MRIDEAILNAYLDGELTATERQWVEQQLATSPQAQAALTQLRQEMDRMNQTFSLLTPSAKAQSPAWLALKRLRRSLRLSHQAAVSSSKTNSQDALPMAWESPALLSEIKNSFKNFQTGRLAGMNISARKNKGILLAGLSLMLMVAILLALQLDMKNQLVNLLPLDFGARAVTSIETAATTQIPDDQLPEDINLVSITFNDEIELVGYKLLDNTATPAGALGLELYWRGLRPIGTDYAIFIQVVDVDGSILSQFDAPPAQGLAFTTTWQPNQIVKESHELVIPPDLPAGVYDVIVGMYNSATGERLLIDDMAGEVKDHLRLTQVTVDSPTLPLAATQAISTIQVVVALQPISRGTQVAPGSVARLPWPVGNLPPGAITNEAEVIGKIAQSDIVQGQVFVQDMFSETPQVEMFRLLAPPAEVESEFSYGIAADPRGDAVANVKHLQVLRFNWVKLPMSWKEVEPRQNNYNWSLWDEVLNTYAEAGINILLTISEAPDWARPADDDKSVAGLPADPAHYAGFVAKVAERYQGRVRAIEVWSGQNIFFNVGGQGRVDPAAYTGLLKQVYTALKAIDPEIVIVSGGLTPTSAPPPAALNDVEYLRQMYANGAKDYFDALGAHPPGFANPPDALYQGGDYDPGRGYDDDRSFFFRNTIEAYRQVMIENGDEAKSLWPTEFGWAVWRVDDERFAFAKENSPEEQAEYTLKAFEMARQWGWVGPMFLWNLDYNLTAPEAEAANFGILNSPTYERLATRQPGAAEQGQASSSPAGEENAEIVLVLDISGSMTAEDFEPDRLSAAKTVVQDFIDHNPGQRIGLVTFASEVVSQIQPGLDHTVLKGAVGAVRLSWDIGLDSGTAIGLGLDAATTMLRDSRSMRKVIILLTDGANNAGNIEPLAAAKVAETQNIRVYTIGLAQQGPARLVFPDGRIEYRDSEIDEETLQQIAEISGGLYFRAEDLAGLQEIYNKIGQRENLQPITTPALTSSPPASACPPQPASPASYLPFSSRTLDFTLEYPEAWQKREYAHFVIFSPTEQGLDPEALADSFIQIGQSPYPATDPALLLNQLMLQRLKELPPSTEILNTGDAVEVGSQIWKMTQLKFDDGNLCGQAIGTVAAMVKDGQGYAWIAVAPAPYWNQLQPVFEKMIANFQVTP